MSNTSRTCSADALPQPWTCLSTHLSRLLSQYDIGNDRKRQCVSSTRFGIKANVKVNDGMLYSSLTGQVAIHDHIAKVSGTSRWLMGIFRTVQSLTSLPSNPYPRGFPLKSRYIDG